MKNQGFSFLRPLPLSLIASGVGAAVTLLVLGVPPLWTAEAAGWAAAIATTAAVVAALWIAERQIGVAREAAASERDTALHLQAVQNEQMRLADQQRAMRLAHAFSRELVYARRQLIAALITWEPTHFSTATRVERDYFASDKPFPDLQLIASFSDRLEGFKDEDAFAILTVLATWNFFNSGPGLDSDELTAMNNRQRSHAAKVRSGFGLDLLAVIEELINRLCAYYEGHPYIVGFVEEPLPPTLQTEIERIKRERADHAA